MYWAALLCLLVVCTSAQVTQRKQFTCNFVMSQSALWSKNATGTIKYDVTNRRYQLSFASNGNNELYAFNSVGGYGKTIDQFLFSFSTTCPCINTPLAFSMPAYAFDASLLTATSVANQYKPKSAGNQLSTVTFATSGYPAASETVNGRKFWFSGCADSTFTAASWPNPTGCSCGSPQDVVVAWDRSSSITYELFLEQKNFAQVLTKGFTYGPLDTNLGMINFNTLTWPGPVFLNKGVTAAAALKGADDLACAPNAQCKVFSSPGACCGSGTCISCGIVAGADMLATQKVVSYERRNAAKVLIIFTDGGQSVLINKNGEDPIRDASGNAIGYSPPALTQDLVDADLRWAVAYAKRRVPGVQIYAVGVGAFVRSQLQIITEGDNSRIFASTAWTDLLGFVGELVQKTCGENTSPCTSCCGSCSCSAWCRQSRALGVTNCADGNSINGDGCDKSCRVENGWNCPAAGCSAICGDGLIVGVEKCDDGNKNNGDGCSSTCAIEAGYVCGLPGVPCTTVCGDGLKRGTEGCDDGNLVSNDGCSAKCVVEDGWTCATPAKPCTPTCGDGKLRGTEACDDGNKVSGDGCSATCGLEKGWDCPTPGKKCIDIDECALWNCIDPFNGGKYPSTCVDSRDIVTPRPAINTRVCTCPLGFYLDGTDQTKITRSVTLTGSAKFPGCRDLNECTLYKCLDASNPTLKTTCADSTSSLQVHIQARTCTCPPGGWYAKQSTSKPPITWVSLTGNAAFTGCMTQCGDGLVAGAELCDDSNVQAGDGCSPTCTVETGFTCSKPGLACCEALEPALAGLSDILQCYNGWWVSKALDASGKPLDIVIGTPREPTLDENGELIPEDSEQAPFVITKDLKICGNFKIAGTVIVQNATVLLAGTLEVSTGGNLTFISSGPAEHGTVDLIDSCGMPGLPAVSPDSPQFWMEEHSSFNINGFNWADEEDEEKKEEMTYLQYLNVQHCIDTSGGALFMGNAEAIPQSSNSFPVISTGCEEIDPEDEEAVAEVEETQTFKNKRPINLPGGCSDIDSYRRSDKGRTDVYAQTNKKDLCEAQVLPLSVFIPAIVIGCVGIAAAVIFGLGARKWDQTEDYVAL